MGERIRRCSKRHPLGVSLVGVWNPQSGMSGPWSVRCAWSWFQAHVESRPWGNPFVAARRGILWGLVRSNCPFSALQTSLYITGWDSNLFWKSNPLSRRHLWVLRMPPNTSMASFTLSVTWRGLLSYWEPSPASPIYPFSSSGAKGRPFIHQPPKKHLTPCSLNLYLDCP